MIGEIVVTGRSFYDFEAKYLGAAGSSWRCPPKSPTTEYEAIRDAAVRAFEGTQARALSRIDFFLTEDGPVLNESTRCPGFTPIVDVPDALGGLRHELHRTSSRSLSSSRSRNGPSY